MAQRKLTKLELQILDVLWAHGKASIREIQEGLSGAAPGLHDYSDHRLSFGSKESRSPCS